jgi:hypothetical protein
MRVDEALLERFEKAVDMPAYLSSRGYIASVPEPDRDHIAMTGPRGDVLRLQKDPERGDWTYANAAAPADRGSLSAFLERHEGRDRKAALEVLIACAQERRRDVAEALAYRQVLAAKPDDLRQAEITYLGAAERRRDAGKMLERLGVSPASLDTWRFGAVRGANDVARLVAEPGPGVLVPSRYRPTDRKLVLVERPIDAVAYEARHGRQQACYIATGSTLDPERARRLAHVLAEARGVEVVVAYGRDRRGEELAAQVHSLAPLSRFERRSPDIAVRWADQMQLEARHARSLGRLGPNRNAGVDRGVG